MIFLVQVLKYVKVSLRPNKVNLLSLNRPAPAHHTPDNHTVVIDETLREFTVSVSGRNAGISVRDPQGSTLHFFSVDYVRFLIFDKISRLRRQRHPFCVSHNS